MTCIECDGKGYTKAYRANKLWKPTGTPTAEQYDEYNVVCTRCHLELLGEEEEYKFLFDHGN